MKRVIIIHGWGGSPKENWFPWLKTEIEKIGYEVITPLMPNTDVPKIDVWVNYLSKIVGVPDRNTYLIGHSIGCQTILRYLEKIDKPIGGAIFVAGWFNLENPEDKEEDEETKEIAKPWVTVPIDVSKIKKVLPKSTLIISDNDSYGAFEENKQKFSEFITKEIILRDAGHIRQKEVPAILTQFLSLIQK